MTVSSSMVGRHVMDENRVRQGVIAASHQQARALEEVALAVRELRGVVEQATRTANESSQMAEEARSLAYDGAAIVERLEHKISALSTVFQQLSSAADTIRGIREHTDRISRIADQSKILALNAGIEAARAGEHGLGFAVVARAVQELSDDTRSAVSRIADYVDSSTTALETSVKQAGTMLEESGEASSELANSLGAIQNSVVSLADHAQSISQHAEEHERGARQLETLMQKRSEESAAQASNLIGLVTGARIEDLSPRVAYSRLSSFVAVDVRRPHEWTDELGHVQDITQMTLDDDFRTKLTSLPKGTPLLFVCRSGGRSARAARMALEEGYKDIYNLKGGMLAWVKDGFPSIARGAARQ